MFMLSMSGRWSRDVLDDVWYVMSTVKQCIIKR